MSRPAGGTIRVVAGTHRGRLLEVPRSGARPTSDRVRQAIFNALDSLGAVDGARVLDAFAGSGALGIEALSRGAAHVTFTDVDPVAVAVVRANLDRLGLADRATVLAQHGATAASSGGAPAPSAWDLVLLDPPYATGDWPALLDVVAAHLAPDGVVVVESDHEVALPPSLEGLRSKAYGGTVVRFARRFGAPT